MRAPASFGRRVNVWRRQHKCRSNRRAQDVSTAYLCDGGSNIDNKNSQSNISSCSTSTSSSSSSSSRSRSKQLGHASYHQLSDALITQLTALGFVWDVSKHKFDFLCDMLCAYKQVSSHVVLTTYRYMHRYVNIPMYSI